MRQNALKDLPPKKAKDCQTAKPAALQAENKDIARALYWQGWTISAIAKHIHTPRTTVQLWKRVNQWDNASPVDKVENSLEARLIQVIYKENKSNADHKEMDSLMRCIERMARIRRYAQTGKESDLNPNLNARNEAPRKSGDNNGKPGTRKNDLNEQQRQALKKAFEDSLFDYQKLWYFHKDERGRWILKSRQIGATWYFAREAILDAFETGRNQIFISASKKQALVFRNYIVDFVQDATGVRLTGEVIKLGNGAELHFLGTNFRATQSYHGNVYIDEAFWINGFAKLHKVARAMASQKQFKTTVFSTPSAKSHEAYDVWTGAAINRKRAKDKQVVIDLDDELLKAGCMGGDRVWRNAVTIYDAKAGGCDLFDIEELELEYAPDDFANLFKCEFIDDSLSAFSFNEMQACAVDSDLWTDYKPYCIRPFGNKPVWVGLDPSYTRDQASIVVVAPPENPGGDFRVLERMRFKGSDFETQAKALKTIYNAYNVAYCGIDVTGGWGQAVYELVKTMRNVVALRYDLDFKNMLVMKAKSVISQGRLKYDAAEVEITRAFISIRRTLTHNQKNVTFESGRTDETGHADVAWAVMQALINEPLDAMGTPRKKTTVAMY